MHILNKEIKLNRTILVSLIKKQLKRKASQLKSSSDTNTNNIQMLLRWIMNTIIMVMPYKIL